MPACKYCGKEIDWKKDGPNNIPVNLDGSLHKPTCKSNGSPAKPSNGSNIMGRISEYEGSNVHISGKTLFIPTEYRRIWQEKYPIGSAVSAIVDKGTCKGMDILTGSNLEKFLKEEEAQRNQQTLTPPIVTKNPAPVTTEQSTENRTSSVDTPPNDAPTYDTSKIKEITIGGTINIQNFENVKIEVTGTDPEEIRKCLIFTASTLGGGHEPTQDLINGYIKRVLHKGGDKA